MTISATGDPYCEPESLGLTTLGELDDRREDYQFSMFVVWTGNDGRLYWADDSGCSCPMPFEDYRTLADLCTGTRSDCVRAMNAWIDGDPYFADAAGRLKRAIRDVVLS